MGLRLRKKPSADIVQQFPESELILNKDGSIYHLNLFPENISNKIIAVGDPGRVHRVSKLFDSIEFEMHRREFITHTGYYKKQRITVMSTGMGTGNIEIFLNELDALANIDLKTRAAKEETTPLTIVRVGTSATIREEISLGTHLISSAAFGLDSLMFFYKQEIDNNTKDLCKKFRKSFKLPFTPYFSTAPEYLVNHFMEDTNMIKGCTLTLPGFYAPQGRKLRYQPSFPNMLDELLYFKEQDQWITNFEMETAGYYALGTLLGHNVLSANAIIANRATQKFSENPNQTIDTLIKIVLDKLCEL